LGPHRPWCILIWAAHPPGGRKLAATWRWYGLARFDPRALRERLEQWRAFNSWEREWGDPPASTDDLVTWYSQAWELSRRYSPGWSVAGVDEEKVARIKRMRRAFARMGGVACAP